MPKTLLFVIDGLSGGGAERIVLTLAKAMVAEGHHVIIASLRDEKAYPLPEGVRYLLVEDSYRGPFWRQTEIKRRARLLDRALAKELKGTIIDFVFSHLPKTDRIVVASKSLSLAWLCIHCALTAGELKNKRGLRRFFKQRQLIQTYSGRHLVTVSKGIQEDILAVGIRPATMVAIYNPLDLEGVRRKAQEKCSLEGECFLVHVGRFNNQKRHDRLLEAFQKSGYSGKLVLLGQGPKQQEIEEQAKKLGVADQVIFYGFVENPYPIIRAAEVLLLSSDYEGLPNVLVEALACGTQAVSTNCPYGPEEILQGVLAQGLCPLDSSSLAEAIQRVLATPSPITENLLEPFTLAESVKKYLALTLYERSGKEAKVEF